MIRVSIEVDSDAARFELSVRAENIQRAVNIAEVAYPSAEVRVMYPIEPETFFVEDPAAIVGLVGVRIESVAG